MRPRSASTICIAIEIAILAAVMIAAASSYGAADIVAQNADRSGSRPQIETLPPAVKAVLEAALEREQWESDNGSRIEGLSASFPLPVCLFPQGRCGALNRDGSIAVPPRFDFVAEFHEGRALVRLAGLYGYVDTSGRVVVEPQYAIAGHYRLGLAEVDIDGKSALIDLDGRQVMPPRFGGIVPFTRTVFWVNDGTRDDRSYPRGSEELPSIGFRRTGSAFRSNARWGLIDATGAWIRKPEFKDIAGFNPAADDLMWARADTGWGLIRPDGTWQ